MTTRTDITFDIRRSPRITIVPNTSDEMIMQDYVDTVRPFEDSFIAMSQPYLMEATGKQDLGGGVLVAITAEEQDMKLEFQPVLTPAETGTVTTPSGAPINGEITFEDSTALFETANVQRGSMVINFTDQSIADVVVVNSETSLTTKVLVNGIGNTYDAADVYHVFNVRQVNSSGGNLVAVDSVDASTTAISPTAFTQVVQATSSSATIANLSTLEAQIADIHGQVERSIFIDTEAGVNGDGYQQSPYNNWSDAVDDAEANGIKSLVLLADATVDRLIKNFVVFGVGDPVVDLNGQNVDKSEFRNLTLTGAMTGEVTVNRCSLNSVTGMDGHFTDCDVGGTCEIAAAGVVTMDNAHSAIAGLSQPVFSMHGSSTGAKLSFRNYSGGLQLTNTNHASDEVTLEFAQGRCTLAASNTGGTISVRGIAQLTDSSAGSTVETSALLNREIVENDVWDALIADHSVAASFGDHVTRRLLTVAKFFSMKKL